MARREDSNQPVAAGGNLSASLEDYLEAIYNLTAETEEIRSKEIAAKLRVARPSVTGALRALKEKGFVHYQPYRSISLTSRGRTAAKQVVRKHDVLSSFFTDVLGIEAELAQQVACRAEHSLGSEVIDRLLSFIEFVNRSASDGYDIARRFKRFHKKGARAGKRRSEARTRK